MLQRQSWVVGTKPVTCQPSPVEPFQNQESYQQWQVCAALDSSLWPVVLVEGTALILSDCQEWWAGDTCCVCGGRPSAGIWEPLRCLLLLVSHVLTLCLPKQPVFPSLLPLGRFFVSPLKNPPGRIWNLPSVASLPFFLEPALCVSPTSCPINVCSPFFSRVSWSWTTGYMATTCLREFVHSWILGLELVLDAG